MSLRIVPFQKQLLPEAAALLAGRHRRDRITLPGLPRHFEEPAEAQKAIERALERPHARGFAALDGERLVAYLIGDMRLDKVWGRSGWVRGAGCAYDPDVGPEIVRDLYAALGAHWVAYGIFFHFAVLPVSDPELIHAWFSLSFGLEQIHALAALDQFRPALPSIPTHIEIRRAGDQDRHALADISDVIWRHQVEAPVWGVQMPEMVDEIREGWSALVDDDDVVIWLAFQDGQLAACQAYWPADSSDENMHLSEQCLHMSVAATRPSARGQGLGTLLTHYGMAQARAEGYRYCEADWRSTNLLASRFWPRRGFAPVVYRLMRRIDPRIAWARGRGS